MYCPSCKHQVPDNSVFCPNCGYTIQSAANVDRTTTQNNYYRNYTPNTTSINVNKKSPVLALILSLIIVGLGQFYVGKVGKGFLMLGLAIFFSIFSMGIAWFAVAVWSAVDAYSTAKQTQ